MSAEGRSAVAPDGTAPEYQDATYTVERYAHGFHKQRLAAKGNQLTLDRGIVEQPRKSANGIRRARPKGRVEVVAWKMVVFPRQRKVRQRLEPDRRQKIPQQRVFDALELEAPYVRDRRRGRQPQTLQGLPISSPSHNSALQAARLVGRAAFCIRVSRPAPRDGTACEKSRPDIMASDLRQHLVAGAGFESTASGLWTSNFGLKLLDTVIH
ncbi:hypothetical protein GMI69_03785 [Eggerthellaceae bacterium zg-887]|uniref:hypothetical protein n=1 Tax=Xiamenia xianingshaonis TaxID=2682776 RepID=UPI00140A9B1C|nr:hypothetical protein [Xiamenia xianingshaonis]NHM15794.1 hypothetical protein [Xiamenia xianingshaonis]